MTPSIANAQISRALDSEATQPGIIEGTVAYDSNYVGIARAEVKIAPLDYVAVTDGRGEFVIPHLPAGTYTLHVSAEGMVPARVVDVVVRPGQTTSLGSLKLTAVDEIYRGEEHVVHANQLSLLYLKEFTVSAGGTGGYTPAESTTGSRVATRVKDLPYAVNMLTSEFFRDFSIFELTEELSYITALTGVEDSGSLVIRGYKGNNTNLRNGFATLGPIDSSSVDRVELIKGPAAAIYGQTSPGGALVITTKRPRAMKRHAISGTYGSYDLSQFQLNLSGPLPYGKNKIFYTFDAQYYRRRYQDPASSSLTRAATAMLAYSPSPDTHLSINGSYQFRHMPATTALPYVYDPATDRYTGFAWELIDKYYISPNDYRDRRNQVVEAFFEHRFNRIFALKAGANFYHRPAWIYQSVGGAPQYERAVRQITNRNTNVSWSSFTGYGQSFAIDLLANYRAWGLEHMTLMTTDRFENRRRDDVSLISYRSFSRRMATDYADFTPYLEVSPANFRPVSNPSRRDVAIDTMGYFLRHQVTAFNGRLIAAAGYRHDRVQGSMTDPERRQGSQAHDANDTALVGLSYKLRPTLSWYANRSEAFLPFDTGTSIGESPPSETSVGYETGLKVDFLDGRISFTADVFTALRKDVEVETIDPVTGRTERSYSGGQKAHGIEFDGNFQLTDRLQALISYTYVRNRLVDQGVEVYAEGKPPRGVPEHSFSSAVLWRAHKAWSFSMATRYMSSTPTETPTTGHLQDPINRRLYTGNDGRADIRTPSFALWNFGVIYTWKTKRPRLTEKLNFTVKNAFDRRYIIPGQSRQVGDRRAFYITYSMEH